MNEMIDLGNKRALFRDSIHHLKSNMDFGYAIKPIMLNQIKNGFHHANKEIPMDILDEQSLEKVQMNKEFYLDMIEKKSSTKNGRYYYLCYQIIQNKCIEHPVPLYHYDEQLYFYAGTSLRIRVGLDLNYQSIDCVIFDDLQEMEHLIRLQTKDTPRVFPHDILEQNEIPNTIPYNKLMGVNNE